METSATVSFNQLRDSLPSRWARAQGPTSVGTGLSIVVPLPSWPLALEPQQYAPLRGGPQHVRCLLCPPPKAANVGPPGPGTGLGALTIVPCPSWPELFSPQQY